MARNFSFSDALMYLKLGKKVAREGWNGKNQYIQLASGISYKTADGEIVNCEHEAIGNKAIAFVGTSGVQMGWLASQADMLADDWRLAEEENEKKRKGQRFRIKIEEIDEQDNPILGQEVELIGSGFHLTCFGDMGATTFAGGTIYSNIVIASALNAIDDNNRALECVAAALKRSKHGPYCDCEVREE